MNRYGFWFFWLPFLFLLAACSQKATIVSNVQESQANEVILKLEEHGIETEKIQNKEAVSVSVQKEDMSRAMELLHEWGLPKKLNNNLGSIFKKDGLISSPLEERARYVYALSQELEQSLGKIDGVITARVHVVLPETDRFGTLNQQASASVLIKHRRDVVMSRYITQIKKFVLNSIPGLTLDHISVTTFVSQNKDMVQGHEEYIGKSPTTDTVEQRSFTSVVLIASMLILLPVIGFLLLRREEIGLWLARRAMRRAETKQTGETRHDEHDT